MNYECPNCGHDMSETEQECKYCGSSNPTYVKPTPSITNYFSNQSRNYEHTTKKEQGKINWILALILIFIAWPIGVLYIVVNLSKK